jgi:cation diffusion facilitator CzcD-associated flavoprotein CzcO
MGRHFEWVVVGGGPAGIASVAKLLDAGVKGQDIAWIDDAFKVGDFGRHWKYVESNTPVEDFIDYFTSAESFEFNKRETPFFIESLPVEGLCPIVVAAEPLHWVSNQFQKKVHCIKGKVDCLHHHSNNWQVLLEGGPHYASQKVILAIGSTPKTLSIPGLKSIPLDVAFNPNELTKHIQHDDSIAVFGCGHSAHTILLHADPLAYKKLYHFYRHQDNFEYYFDGFESDKVEHIKINQSSLFERLKTCNKVVYAIGFKKRHLSISGLPNDYEHDNTTGEIVRNLYGIGMAFPGVIRHQNGQSALPLTAINDYMDRLHTVLPKWLGSD